MADRLAALQAAAGAFIGQTKAAGAPPSGLLHAVSVSPDSEDEIYEEDEPPQTDVPSRAPTPSPSLDFERPRPVLQAKAKSGLAPKVHLPNMACATIVLVSQI